MIANQPHMLAYINPQEEMLLRQLGGTGQAGPMGVPAYPPGDGGFSPDGSGGYGGGGGFGGYGGMGGGYGRDDYAGGNTSVGSYNAAVSRASQPLSRDYNATDRNRDLAAISSYNATATTSAPVEVEVAPVSIDSGMGAAIAANDGISFTDSTSVPTSNIGVNTGLSGEEFDDIGVANNTGSGGVSAGVTGTDFDFGMGSDDGVGSSAGDSSAGEVTVDPTNTSGGTTTSIVGTSMFDNMRALRGLPPLGETVSDVDTSRSNIGSSGYVSLDAIADNSGVSDIGPSGYVSLDAIADTKVDPETNYSDSDTVYDDQILRDLIGQNYTDLQSEIGNITDSDTVYDDQILRDLIGQNYTDFQSQIDNLTDRINNPYAIDITDTNIYTENPDGTYTVEDGEPDPIEMGGDGEGEPPANGGDGNGIDTTETTATTSIQDPAEYFNLFRSTAPSGWMRDSIWNSVGTGPDFDVDVYQEADGSLRFRETGELVPEEYMKYIDLARRTEMDAPEEETA
jgi:hypothetical protein